MNAKATHSLSKLLLPFSRVLSAPQWAWLSFRRLTYRPGVTLLDLFGVILAVGLLTNASFFARGVDRAILGQELRELSRVTGRPPFSMVVQVSPSSRSPMTVEEAEANIAPVSEMLAAGLDIPVRRVGLQIAGGTMMLQAQPGSPLYQEDQDYLTTSRVVYIQDVSPHIQVVEGTAFEDVTSGGTNPAMDVWMHNSLAQKMGMQIGDYFQLKITLSGRGIPIRMAGFWQAADPQDEFWYSAPDSTYADALLVRRADYVRFVQPALSSRTRQVQWYVILDETRLRLANLRVYIEGMRLGQQRVLQHLPNARFLSSPNATLEEIAQRSNTLTVQLLTYNLPALSILLAFLALNSAIIARWQQREMSTMASRGMSVWKILRIPLFEQLLIFVIGGPLGILAGMAIARSLGYANGFLSFIRRSPLPVSLKDLSLQWIFLALGLSLLTRLWTALRVSRRSLLVAEREWARSTRAPFWQRYYLDFLLLFPALYLYHQMIQRGALARAIMERPADFYRDPLLILVPAVFIFAGSLGVMRLFSLCVRIFDGLSDWAPGLSIPMAFRNLGRQNHDYHSPLLLVLLACGLGVYTLATSSSLDRWSVDQWYYRTGSDLAFTAEPPSVEFLYEDGSWIPPPEEFRSLEGVEQATRVADLPVAIRLAAGQEIRGRFLGIDRVDFPATAWFRRDLAEDSLGELMNRLALNPMGVLVSDAFAARQNLHEGDRIRVFASSDLDVQERSLFNIVGFYRYFPTVYENEAPAVIGNLDGYSLITGFTVSHDLWLKLEQGESGEEVLKQVFAELRVRPARVRNARAEVAQQGTQLERVGAWGTYTAGFLSAMLMAVLGLVVFSYASLKERVYQLAVLRALGMSRGQMLAQMIAEYVFLSVFGVLAGVAIGSFAAQLILPSLILSNAGGLAPPLLPVVPMQRVWWMGMVIVIIVMLIELATVLFALRQNLAIYLKNP